MSALLYYRTLLTVCDRYLHAPEDSAKSSMQKASSRPATLRSARTAG